MIKVLIIDDDPRQRESLGDVVDSFGYAVDAAQDLDEAKVVIRDKGPISLVLLDYMFGPNKKTGLDALGDLRQLLPVEEVPILLMTGYASLDVAVKALRQGLSDFLIKPIEPTYLRHTLEKNLEKARLLTENRRLFQELQIKNEELGRLNDLKSKFLSFCAHDLSNTVSSCTMASDLLGTEISSSGSPQAKRLTELLRDALSQTQRLIGDLVDWSAIEKGKFHIDKQKITAAELLSAPVFTFLGEKAKAKGVRAEIDCRVDKDLEIMIDSRRIIQVITNLLENGLRYTPTGGMLSFRMEKDAADGALAFHVIDTGEGIDPDDAPHLFERFYQGKDPKKQRGRLGLGLSIAKEIIESHGGNIQVLSEGRGKGTTFSFKIPLG
ncbi:MAG: response regulator [Elusimicrobia bacterium]|nr:response regulator [Elusimicrobiota bacterium]